MLLWLKRKLLKILEYELPEDFFGWLYLLIIVGSFFFLIIALLLA